MIWNCGPHRLDLSQRGLIMGILNVTPDSFSDGGQYFDPAMAVERARQMLEDGASIIDIGGESTRPGADPVDDQTEQERVLPVIQALHENYPNLIISIDTAKASVARAAVNAGACIINDVTGLTGDPQMAETVAQTRAGVVIMHMRGTPRSMQQSPEYEDVVGEIRQFFEQQLTLARNAGIKDEQILWDPGIGFGKALEHNLAILGALDQFQVGGRPVLLGVSRKSFFQKLTGADVDNRLWCTVAVTADARAQGVRVHRVHDVRPNLEALRMMEAIDHARN